MCCGPPEESIILLKRGQLGNKDFLLRIWVTGYADFLEDFAFTLDNKAHYKDLGTPALVSGMYLFNMNNPNVKGSTCDWAIELDGKFYTSEPVESCLREEFVGDFKEGFENLGSVDIDDFGDDYA